MIALALKNVRQHSLPVFGAVLLVAFMSATAWIVVLTRQLPTLLSSATSIVYYIVPLLILFLNERFVAQDALDGTSEFLGALPISPGLRMTVAWASGTVVILAVCEALLLTTGLLASRREGIPLGWFLQVHAQVGLYVLGWHAVSFAVVHTGRFRWLIWWVFLSAVMEFDGSLLDAPFRRWLWTAPLADTLDQARSAPPWDAIGLVALWTLASIAVAVWIRVHRGGALFDRLYAPWTSRRRAGLVVAGIVSVGLIPLVTGLAPAQPDPWRVIEPVPARVAQVRVVGRDLAPVAADVTETLDAIAATYALDDLLPLVLVRGRRGLGRHVVPAEGDGLYGSVLLVDPTGPHDRLVRDVLHWALIRQTGGHGPDLPEVDALLHGLPALHHGSTPQIGPAADYRSVLLARGPDVAEGTAAQQTREWRQRDAEGFTDTVGRILAGSAPGVPARLRLQWLARAIPDGPDGPVGPAQEPVTLIVDEGVLRAESPRGPDDVHLEVVELDPLQPEPRLGDPRRTFPFDSGSLAIPVAPTEAVAVRWASYDPSAQRWTYAPWTIR